jgi:uracil-DNA glycosylase family 4
VVLIGEQPGDMEDRQGRPFVEPAGAALIEGLLSSPEAQQAGGGRALWPVQH